MIKAFFEVDVHDPREIQENGQVVGDDTMEIFVAPNLNQFFQQFRAQSFAVKRIHNEQGKFGILCPINF